MIAISFDGDGASGQSAWSEPKASVRIFDQEGKELHRADFPSSGNTQLALTGEGAVTYGGKGAFKSWPNGASLSSASLQKDAPQAYGFWVSQSFVSITNVGYGGDGNYSFEISTVRENGAAQNVSLPVTVMTAGVCGKQLFLTATDEGGDTYRQRHSAYIVDPVSGKYNKVATWIPSKATLDAFGAYSSCKSNVLYSVLTEYESRGGSTEPIGNVLESISTTGRRRVRPISIATTSSPAVFPPYSGRESIILGDALYWVGTTQDLNRVYMLKTVLSTGATTVVFELRTPGARNREKRVVLQGAVAVSIDQGTEGEYLVSVQRLVDGSHLVEPKPLQNASSGDLGPRVPRSAVVLDGKLAAGVGGQQKSRS